MATETQVSGSLADGGSEAVGQTLFESVVQDVHYHDATAGVFLSAFVGLAFAWATGGMAPWAGALVGGGVSYVAASLLLASPG